MTPLLHITLLISLSFTVAADVPKLNAVSDSKYTHFLYQRLRTDDPPSGRDPAIATPLARKRICDHILGSGFYDAYGLKAVDTSRLRTILNKPSHSSIFHQVFRRSKNPIKRLLSLYEYENAFTLTQFNVIVFVDEQMINPRPSEWVFVCPLKHWHTNAIVPIYVSKEYNVAVDGLYTPGRFLFEQPTETLRLAEAAAGTYKRPDYNIELHYIHLRKSHQPATNVLQDPVCQHTNRNSTNQHDRLCAIALASSHFENKVSHPQREHSYKCIRAKVLFRTESGREAAVGNSYHEWTIACRARRMDDKKRHYYYISRAYTTHQVFVYWGSTVGYPLYLEALLTDVSFVREPAVQVFDDVEA